jgi:cysteine desulfurase
VDDRLLQEGHNMIGTSMNTPIYLDYNATTPVDPEVAALISNCLVQGYGNPSSSHALGRTAKELVDQARRDVANLIGAHPDEIVFTGCATEANNLALLGVAAARGKTVGHLIISAIEHPAVAKPAQALARQGWDVTVVAVDQHGRINVGDIEAALRPDTVLVSIMHSNNEVGTLQPISEVSAITKAHGILLHTDAAQSIGKVRVNVDALGVDLLTLAGHKFYAPKGIGALYVRKGTSIRSVLHGADHERGLRPGTENVPYIAGFGLAAAHCRLRGDRAEASLRALRDDLHQRLSAAVPGLQLNGHPEFRLPNTLNVSFTGVSGRALLEEAQGVAASVGSACHSDTDKVSGVLAAMGASPSTAFSAVRLSVGLNTTEAELEQAAAMLAEAYWRLSK